MPPGETFEFIIEADKLEKIKKVVAHNHGEVLEETQMDGDARLRIRKVD
ncbi:MAG: hypothetical protein WAL98_10205 [Desulfatiglandaceae bacterium]